MSTHAFNENPAGVRWKRIAVLATLLGSLLAAIPMSRLLHQDKVIRVVPAATSESVEFVLTLEFAADNDLLVLGAVLSHQCDNKSDVIVLYDEPIGRVDERSGTAMAAIPKAVACPGIRIASQKLIDRPYESGSPSRRGHMERQNPENGFHAQFPGASGVMKISMPSYSHGGTYASVLVDYSDDCPNCGSGWNSLLRKINGTLVVSQRIGRWIS